MKIPAALLVLLLLTGAVASAQRAGQAQGAAPVPPGEIQKLLDGYEFVQAQEYLGLTDAQFGQFLPKLRVLQDARRRNEQERMRLLMELRRMTNPRSQAAESDIQTRVRALGDVEMKAASEIQGARDAIDQVLNVRQQALFRLFQQEIEQRKLQLLMRTRQQQQQQNRANRPLANPKN